MSSINHARHAHRGRPTEMAFAPKPKWNPNAKAVAANAGRSLSREQVAAWASAHGCTVANDR